MCFYDKYAVRPRGTNRSSPGQEPLLTEKPMETSHITALKARHAGIEAQIHDEMLRPAPDDGRIQRLKKEKLRIKQELAAN